jgi:hypothetical protein
MPPHLLSPAIICSLPSAERLCVRTAERKRGGGSNLRQPRQGSIAGLATETAENVSRGPLCARFDGARIAITERLQQHGRIRIVDLKTGGVRELSIDRLNLDSIAWSADGQALFVTSWSSLGETLLRVALDGATRVLYKFSTWFERPFASPDGRYLAFAQLHYDSNAWMVENFR